MPNAFLLKACLDFARVAAAIMDTDVVPSKHLIESIIAILEEDEKYSLSIRYFFDFFYG